MSATPADAGNVPLTIERVFDDPALNGPVARLPKLSPDGRLATWLRPNDSDFLRLDLWAAPVAGGAPFMLVDSRALVPEEGELSEEEKARRERQRLAGSRGLVDYDWDQKGEAILAPLGGDLWYVPVANPASPVRLTQTPAFETDGRISPAGGFVSFIRDGALRAVRLSDRTEIALSPPAAGTVTFGMADFIAQEEMDRDTGYWWAPGDAMVAYTRVDEGPVAIIPRVEIGAASTQIVDQRYPRAGAANVLVQLFVRSLATGRDVQVDLGAETDIYLARVDWSRDGRTLYVQRQNREQTRLDLLMVDPVTGASRVIVTQTDPAWVNLTHDFKPLRSGGFLWSSEEGGHRRVVRYDRDGTGLIALSPAGLAVQSITGVDETAGRVFFLAPGADVTTRRLYSAALMPEAAAAARRHPRGAAPAAPAPMAQPVTPDGGVWTATMAQGGAAFLGGWSSPDTPPRLGLYRSDGSLVRWLIENPLDASHPWWPHRANRAQVRFGTLTGPSGATLHWSMHLPPGFDPSKRWPVIQYVYGGPGVQVVQRNWGSNTDQLHANRGYVVFRIDNRGTPNRGRDFERALAGRLGGPETEDQLAGLAFLKTQSFVDTSRIGVWGWSYGGYMALRLATEAPDAFAAAAAGAPVTDWSLYDTHYTERYMGKPQDRPEAYGRASVLPRLKDVRRPLLILHGMADDNVTFDNATMAFDRLQGASVPFEAMVYPGQKHGIREKARAIHVQTTILNFFDRHLGPGPR